MIITPYSLAERFIGIKEIPGAGSSPFVMSFLTLDQSWPGNDEVPWCSAFVNYIHWLLRLPRTKDLRARSWLTLGDPAVQGRRGDIVVIRRGSGSQPGSEVIDAPGHVGFFSSYATPMPGKVYEYFDLLAGNQGDQVSVARFPVSSILGIRRFGTDHP